MRARSVTTRADSQHAWLQVGRHVGGSGLETLAPILFSYAFIHRSAWKGYSPKFVGTEFSEVGGIPIRGGLTPIDQIPGET
jgi:hypothetical protein